MEHNKTLELACFASALRFEDLPAPVVRQTSRFLLDALGCALGAYREDLRKTDLITKTVEGMQAAGRSTAIGIGAVHPTVAALGNGMLINATDNDDTHKRALVHVASVVVPAALAMTEHTGGSGKDLVAALVAGYEVTARVGMAVMPTHYRFWHSTATNGTFGAAAAAGRAMALNPEQIRAAFGFAGTQAAGLNTFFESGDDTKALHPGKAGFNGVLSAQLAAMGMTSPPDIFGHPKGYLAAYSLEPKPEMLTRGLGSEWMILDNGFKYFPSILASHSPIGASLDIYGQDGFDAGAIKSVSVKTYSTVKSHFSSKQVDTIMAARLSVPYCVAVALVDGEVKQNQFTPERFNNAVVRDVMNKVEIVADEDLTKLYPEKFPAQVTVELADGRTFSAKMYYPKGDPSNALSDEELEVKFRANADGVVPADKARDLFDMISNVATLSDLSGLVAILSARSGAK